ncbi:MAG: hypothetical protein E4H07_09710 [Nitrosomonadales bacterium]|nr:MAG: hypothetical protein E4H07_09710 [Nitrosomonadales bacterium]
MDAYDLGWKAGYLDRQNENPYEEDTDDWQEYEDGYYDGSKNSLILIQNVMFNAPVVEWQTR